MKRDRNSCHFSVANTTTCANFVKMIHRFPECAGDAQSPINIETEKLVEDDGERTEFVFDGYDKPVHGQLIDNGHSLSIPPLA